MLILEEIAEKERDDVWDGVKGGIAWGLGRNVQKDRGLFFKNNFLIIL